MIDLSRLGGPSGAPGMVGPTAPVDDSLPDLPAADVASKAPASGFGSETPTGEMPWDTAGRMLWGTEEQGGTLLGRLPVLGDLGRVPGNVVKGLTTDAGVGIGTLTGAAADALGRVPLQGNYGLGTPGASGINGADQTKYPASPEGVLALINDARRADATLDSPNTSDQFMVLGQWQQANDPEGFKAWQAALEEAQKSTGIGSHAGDLLQNYIRSWGAAYSDLTSEGVSGLYDVMPEMAFSSGPASAGQGIADTLGHLMLLQRKAERGAASLSGNVGGLGGVIGGLVTGQKSAGYAGMGSRLNQLLASDPKDLTDIEATAVAGMNEQGWTAQHAYNFLVSHGQGFSSEGITQVALSMALDPVQVGTLGAGLTASVAGRVEQYAQTAESANRIKAGYQAVAKTIGTTVADVRGGPLGPAFKAARTIIDPFSALGNGTVGAAKADVFAAAGLEGTTRGFGAGAVANMMKRASKWGAKDIVDTAYGQTAMNFARKWAGNEHVQSMLAFGEATPRTVITEEALQALGRAAPKDAASRVADYVYGKREFWLSDSGLDSLAERIAKVVKQPIGTIRDDLVDMSRDEQAVWHATSYSQAFREFTQAKSAIPPDEWGKLSTKLDDLVILNPHELDNVAAQSLHATISKLKTPEARIKAWNAAADKYSLIQNLGRVQAGGKAMIERRLNALDSVISRGQLHTALDIAETKALPQRFKTQFLDGWTDSTGQPMWRMGFKPRADQATGLVYDAEGKLMQAYEPNVENVIDAIPVASGASTPVTDILGRVIPDAVKDLKVSRAIGDVRDALDVAMQTATDSVSGQRLMNSMEQSFTRQMRDVYPGIPEATVRRVFKVNREYAQEHGFTLAGLSPDEFWRASAPELETLIDARVAKRDVFGMLATSAGGDLRLIGLSSGLTQRIRSGLIARGKDPNNYLGAVTVKLYNMLRYTLNPTFFLQAEFDAPWFNMYRGVMFDLKGKAPAIGSPIHEMQQINQAMGHTGLARDLQMDFTERVATIGMQQDVLKGISDMPGVDRSIGQRFKNWSGRMILNNELAYMNSKVGDVVIEAMDHVRTVLDEKIAASTSAAEKQSWADVRMDHVPMLDYLKEELTTTLGHVPTNDELGRRYLSEMIEDSRLEVRTEEGLLNYKKVISKGVYHSPTEIGDIKPLDLDYGVEYLALPNIHSVKELRKAVDAGTQSIPDIRDKMIQLGVHPDAAKRFTNAIKFNWRSYFDGLSQTLGMTRSEMEGIEVMITKTAKAAGMSNVDYLTQVLPMTARKGAKDVAGQFSEMEDVDNAMRYTLKVMRAATKKGGADVDEMTKLVSGHLQPSMKQTLLDHFMDRIQGPRGLIEGAMASGDTAAAQDLNKVLEDLKGGWGNAADDQFRDLVLRRAGGETLDAAEPEVERAARYFSQFLQDSGPSIQAGQVLKGIADAIPTEGASAHNFTQGLLMDTLHQGIRLTEKDAIRLAHMSTERTNLERSLNHPFFAMYPSSYFWGKVIPETFKFIAYNPFGMKTSAGAQAYLHVKQSIELQSMYDDGMKKLWDSVGKSSVVGLLSYLSPAMPWEDMASNAPPWVRALSKDFDFSEALSSEFDTFSPERWVRKFAQAGKEVGGIVEGTGENAGNAIDSLTAPQQQGLETIGQENPPVENLAPLPSLTGPTKGVSLGPVLQGEMSDLQDALSGR